MVDIFEGDQLIAQDNLKDDENSTINLVYTCLYECPSAKDITVIVPN